MVEASHFVLKYGSVTLPNHLLTIAYGKQGKAEAKNKGLNEEDERVDNMGRKE